jgi:MYXO-CTERM domain-containing protein
MPPSRFLGFLPSLALSLLAPSAVFAADAGAGPCTETSYGMPCDSGDGNACSGVCQPDFSKTGAPMACLLADATTLARLKLTSLDGIDCAPASQPGTDCTHACSAGACVLKNAAQGSACIPPTAPDASATNVCGGTCDGNGACGALDHACGMKYGRGELTFCLYSACSPAANVGCEQFPIPDGETCSTGDVCIQGETCSGSRGACTGGTRISGCTEPNDGDPLTTHETDASVTDAGVTPETDADTKTEPTAATAPASAASGGGCAVATSPTSGGTAGLGALVVGLALARSRRRSRATTKTS